MSKANRITHALVAAAAAGAIVAPAAVAAAVNGGNRNPSGSEFTRETEFVGNIASNQGGHAPRTGGYTTRQSNKSDTGGGAIYGCRARAGSESCVAANNLSNGDAFRFQSTAAAATIGQLRFGLDLNKTVDKPPFTTNGTGLVKNLNADRIDGKSAEDFAAKTALDDYVAKGSLLFAAVGSDGAIAANRGVPANGRATVAADGANQVFTVPFSSDISKCVATANPTAVVATDTDVPLVIAVSDTKTVTVTEQEASAPYGFALQVTC